MNSKGLRNWALALTIVSQMPAETGAQSDLAALISQAEQRRDAKVHEVVSTRQYTVRNSRWKSNGTMLAKMITSAGGAKRYEVIEMNADGMRRKILLKILEGEVDAAARRQREGNVNAENYEVRNGGPAENETCRKVELVAKKRSKLTFNGSGCVDLTDMAMVRMEGRTSKNVSFFIGRAYVVQEFRKVGEFWYSSRSRSTADVKFLGPTELAIDYLSYRIVPKAGAVIESSLDRDSCNGWKRDMHCPPGPSLNSAMQSPESPRQGDFRVPSQAQQIRTTISDQTESAVDRLRL